MRVVFLNPTTILKRPVAELSKALDKQGHKVGVITPKPKNQMHYSNFDDTDVDLMTYTAFNPPISSEFPIPITPLFFWHMLKVIWTYDIIHVFVPYYISSVMFIIFGRLFGKTVILTMDTIPAYSFKMGGFMDVLFKIYGKCFGWLLFNMPNKVHLYSNLMRPFAKEVNIMHSRIEVISTGVHLNNYINNIQKDNKYPVVLFVGIICQRKGVDIIIETIKKLNNKNIKMLMVGDSPNRNKFEKMSEGLNINYVGWSNDVNYYYRNSDIFLFPSRGEGLAGAIMEASASGLPVITSDIPCSRDLVLHNETGFICNMDDIDDFSNRLQQLINNKDLRRDMGRKAQEHMKNFEWSKLIDRYERFYNEFSTTH